MSMCNAHAIPSLLSPADCNAILVNLPSLSRSEVVDEDGKIHTSHSRTCWDGWIYPTAEWKWLTDKMLAAIHTANDAHYGFDITSIEALQVLRYRPLQMFAPHFDNNAPTVASRKLTLVTQLSPPSAYVGGRLHVFGSASGYYSKGQGDGIVFPPYLLHAALPVLLGTRYALVVWARGPHWR
jgi:PKHD-type hydroxylase